MTSEVLPTTGARAGLTAILKGFPQHSAALQRLFQANRSFQSLCEDFDDCLAALQQWEQSTAPEAPAMHRVYAELLGELEQEVRQFLEDEKISNPLPGKHGPPGIEYPG